MFTFLRRRRKKRAAGGKTASTFVEATGGGWGEAPDVVPVDGGDHADFVGEVLAKARLQVDRDKVPVGATFEYTITDIPVGIDSPHAIVFGLMMRASEQGLVFISIFDETVTFVRDV